MPYARPMSISESWAAVTEAIGFAASRVAEDEDLLNERELADGNQYVMRILQAVAETNLVAFDFDRPAFMTMRESVRHLGAAGPDIDYDVAIVAGGHRYRITGNRGDASYVGIVVYGAGGAEGASSILDAVDVDSLIDGDGSFTYDVDHPDASRIIVRQYFHDRAANRSGEWRIERLDAPTAPAGPAEPLPQLEILAHRFANGAQTLRWNAQLNQLWTPERRNRPVGSCRWPNCADGVGTHRSARATRGPRPVTRRRRSGPRSRRCRRRSP